jgi:eukaryotic-like serine/threonine-protein kinase
MAEVPKLTGTQKPPPLREQLAAPRGAPVRTAEARVVAPERDNNIPPGTLVSGHYRVVRKLGGGSIGHVYEAINTWTTRRVALKLLRAELVDDDEIAQRFLLEAQAATRVAHPHIVDILDMGKDPVSGHLFIVQEFLEGKDLHAHLKQRGRLVLAEAQQILVPIMMAVAAAHEKQVLHRDLKPENIFLVQSPDGHTVPKVIDFGLARSEESTARRVTRAGSVMGTPFYMSPEQARGDSDIDARTDVWSMAVIWYEVLVGVVPFEGEGFHAVLQSVFMSTPERLDERVPDVSKRVADVIHQGMSRDSNRYPTMNDFLGALLHVLPDEASARAASLRGSRPGVASYVPTASTSPSPGRSNTFSPLPPPLPAANPEGVVPLVADGHFPPTQAGVAHSDQAMQFATKASADATTRRIRVLQILLGSAWIALAIVGAMSVQLVMTLRARNSELADLRTQLQFARSRHVAGAVAMVPPVGAPPHDAGVDVRTDASTDAFIDAPPEVGIADATVFENREEPRRRHRHHDEDTSDSESSSSSHHHRSDASTSRHHRHRDMQW